LVERGTPLFTIPLELSIFFESESAHWLAHNTKEFSDKWSCAKAVREKAKTALRDFAAIHARLDGSKNAHRALLDWKVNVGVGDVVGGDEWLRIIETTHKELSRLAVGEAVDEYVEHLVVDGKKWRRNPGNLFSRLRTGLRDSRKDERLKATGDSVLPLEAIYEDLFGRFRAERMKSDREPTIERLSSSFTTDLPILRRGAYIFQQELWNADTFDDNVKVRQLADRLVKEEEGTREWLVAEGMLEVVDIWAVVKPLASLRLELTLKNLLPRPGLSSGEQYHELEKVLKNEKKYPSGHVFWVFVLSWLSHS
jgi:hypothetical protein